MPLQKVTDPGPEVLEAFKEPTLQRVADPGPEVLAAFAEEAPVAPATPAAPDDRAPTGTGIPEDFLAPLPEDPNLQKTRQSLEGETDPLRRAFLTQKAGALEAAGGAPIPESFHRVEEEFIREDQMKKAMTVARETAPNIYLNAKGEVWYKMEDGSFSKVIP